MRNSSDKILTAADYERIKIECKERQVPIKSSDIYTVTYNINGHLMSEKIFAKNTKDAEEIIKRNCGMVGWIPRDIKILTNS
jgi:hypothetical protein